MGLLLTAYLAFIGLGLPDAMTGVAWPSVRETFSRGQGGLGLILTIAAAGYLVSSACSGLLQRMLRLGDLLTLSSLIVVFALLGAATAGSWVVFLACSAALGLGGGAIDAAINLFVAIRFGARQLNWLHAFYGVGAALGPLIVTAALVADWGWRWGIAAIAVALAPLILLYAATREAWSVDGGSAPGAPHLVGGASPSVGLLEILGTRATWLQVAAFFTVTGLEATAGQWSYSLLTEARGFATAAAGAWVGAFWTAFTLARLIAGAVVRRVGGVRLTRLAAIAVIAGAVLFAVAPTPLLGCAGLVLIGLSVAPLFPGLMAETPRRLGAGAANHAIGLQVSGAVLGAATLPALAGLAAGAFGLWTVTLVPIAAGLVVLLLNEALISCLDRPRTDAGSA
jgi:fucose permease